MSGPYLSSSRRLEVKVLPLIRDKSIERDLKKTIITICLYGDKRL